MHGLLLLLSIWMSLAGQEPQTVRVGIKSAPPFVIKEADGAWSGLTVELWKEIAAELELKSEFQEQELTELLDGLANKSLDVVPAAITITAEREEKFDFSHPFYTSGLGIALSKRVSQPGFWAGFPVMDFLKAMGALIAILMIAAVLVWFAERKRNREQFPGGIRGLAEGFWWSAVTMTTVGYGDKAPTTLFGRTVAVVWMFVSIFFISAFTASIASVMTTASLEAGISGPQDLYYVATGAVENSTAANYLAERNVSITSYSDSDDALQALARGEIDAFVHDAPILHYLTNREFPGVATVLPNTFYAQQYGIGMQAQSPLREDINRLVLKITTHENWKNTLDRYLGN